MLCPHTEYPTNDERWAEQERIPVAVERMLGALDAGRYPRCAAEIRTRQRAAGAVYTFLSRHLMCRCPRSSADAEAEGGEGKER